MINIKKINYFIFIICFICSSASVDAQDNNERDQRKFNISTVGSCISEQGSTDLESVFFLKNSVIKQSEKDGYRLLSFRGDRFRIEHYLENHNLKRAIPISVSLEILDKIKDSDSIDIELSFVLLDNNVALYWKETYQHRMYRQGIFKVQDDKLTSFCLGKGGNRKFD